jgi:hypothetical protein
MRPKKAFDCVAMKDAIQRKHAEKYEGMTDEERWGTVERKLAGSKDIVAEKWRSLRERPNAVAK